MYRNKKFNFRHAEFEFLLGTQVGMEAELTVFSAEDNVFGSPQHRNAHLERASGWLSQLCV